MIRFIFTLCFECIGANLKMHQKGAFKLEKGAQIFAQMEKIRIPFLKSEKASGVIFT